MQRRWQKNRLILARLFTTNSNAQKEGIKIATNEKEIIVEENGYKHTIKIKKELDKITTYVLDENNIVLNYFVYNNENKKLYSSITNQYSSLSDEEFNVSNLNYMISPMAGGNGTKENPYKYCTPCR